MNYWVVFGGLVDLILLVFMAGANLALGLPSRVKVAEQFERAGKADLFEKLLAVRSELLLATAMIRSAASLALVLIILTLWGGALDDSVALKYVTALVGALALTAVFGVAIPAAWAKYSGDFLLLRMTPVLFAARRILRPFLWILGWADPFIRRLSGIPNGDLDTPSEDIERTILDVVSQAERRGSVDEQEKEMIESVMELRDTEVHEVMTPRTDIVGLPQDATLQEVKDLIAQHGHSRIPVYQDTIDEVVGLLYAKDLLQLDPTKEFEAKNVMRPVPFVPETKRVRELLREFQQTKVHIALILDEYGGTAGLVTIEDIIEELVGEIVDEYEDPEREALVRIDERTVEVDARIRIDDLNDELDTKIPENDDYETIGGFVFCSLGRIPKAGERFEHGDVSIEVLSAEPRKINRLKLERMG